MQLEFSVWMGERDGKKYSLEREKTKFVYSNSGINNKFLKNYLHTKMQKHEETAECTGFWTILLLLFKLKLNGLVRPNQPNSNYTQ